jgi:peptide-methionine (S)-S-oxide reductase
MSANKSETPSGAVEVATLGGGCFWCTEAIFKNLRGVLKVESGYSGGWVANPTYKQVCSGTTGHAEVVQITFNPFMISFRELLEVFFSTHDPTTVNRQGADVGSQYRSIILYHTDTQKAAAETLIDELNSEGTWNKPLVTQVEPYKALFQAEDYHRNYFEKNPEKMYCQLVIAPKMKKLQQRHPEKLKN